MSDTGMAELRRKLQSLDAEALKAVRPRLQNVVLMCEAEAKKNCTPGQSPYDGMVFPTKLAKNPGATGAPFDMGLLRGTIRGEVVEDKTTLKATISASTNYAEHVHEGTSKMQGRPFLVDAVMAKRSAIITTLGGSP